jgi:hypothetical protein
LDELIRAALTVAGDTHSVADVCALVERGDAHLWIGKRCVIVTEFFVAPRLKALNFWLLGGDLKELLAMAAAVEAWAKQCGCTHAFGAGRKEWGRVLRRHGYRPTHVTFEKEL